MLRLPHRRRFLATAGVLLTAPLARVTRAAELDALPHDMLGRIPQEILQRQNPDGSWGEFPENKPEQQRRLVLETSALAMLAISHGPVPLREWPARSDMLRRGFTFLARAVQEFIRRESLDESDQRLLALASLALLEDREPPADEDRDILEETAARRIGELLAVRLRNSEPAVAWHFVVLAAGKRKGLVAARQALDEAKRLLGDPLKLFAVDRPWAWLVYALVSNDKSQSVAQAEARSRRENWVESFDDAFFCTVAFDRVACLAESQRYDPTLKAIEARVTSASSYGIFWSPEWTRPHYTRPDWTRWQLTIRAGIVGDPPALLRRDRDSDVGLSLPDEWRKFRLDAKRKILWESYGRRSWSSGEVER